MAGYSQKSLIEKLGVKSGNTVLFVNAPAEYMKELGALPDEVWIRKTGNSLDFIHFFTDSRKELQIKFPELKKKLAAAGMLWISWPKKSSGKKADVDENGVREIGLQNGLVDVKVCAVTDIWSGLKFVFRLKDRPEK